MLPLGLGVALALILFTLHRLWRRLPLLAHRRWLGTLCIKNRKRQWPYNEKKDNGFESLEFMAWWEDVNLGKYWASSILLLLEKDWNWERILAPKMLLLPVYLRAKAEVSEQRKHRGTWNCEAHTIYSLYSTHKGQMFLRQKMYEGNIINLHNNSPDPGLREGAGGARWAMESRDRNFIQSW